MRTENWTKRTYPYTTFICDTYWWYLLIHSTDASVLKFKNYLNSKNIDDDLIARAAGLFYSKSSSTLHNFLRKLTLNEVEDALKEHAG